MTEKHTTGMLADCLPERRSADTKACSMIDDINKRLDDGDARMDRIEAKIDANNSDTAEVLDILRLGKSFFRIVGGLGSIIKWGAAVAAPVIALIYTLKSGGKP